MIAPALADLLNVIKLERDVGRGRDPEPPTRDAMSTAIPLLDEVDDRSRDLVRCDPPPDDVESPGIRIHAAPWVVSGSGCSARSFDAARLTLRRSRALRLSSTIP